MSGVCLLALPNWWQGTDDEALVWLRRSLEANRNYPAAHFNLAAALALVGELDEARVTARGGPCSQSEFLRSAVYRTNTPSEPSDLSGLGAERVYEGLRLAGVREG